MIFCKKYIEEIEDLKKEIEKLKTQNKTTKTTFDSNDAPKKNLKTLMEDVFEKKSEK